MSRSGSSKVDVGSDSFPEPHELDPEPLARKCLARSPLSLGRLLTYPRQSAGLLIGSLLVVLDTTHPQKDIVKRYIVFITYLAQVGSASLGSYSGC